MHKPQASRIRVVLDVVIPANRTLNEIHTEVAALVPSSWKHPNGQSPTLYVDCNSGRASSFELEYQSPTFESAQQVKMRLRAVSLLLTVLVGEEEVKSMRTVGFQEVVEGVAAR